MRPWGWDGPARAMLIVVAAMLGLGLAWVTRGGPAGPAAVPILVADANSAPAAVLEALPGLGPKLAGAIVEARPFRSIDDLDRRVKGIGPAKVAAIRPFLRFDDPRP